MMTAKRTLLITGGSGYLGRHLTVKATDAFQVYTTYVVCSRQLGPRTFPDTISFDLRLTVTRVEHRLHMTFPGVDEVLAEAAAQGRGVLTLPLDPEHK